MDNLSHGRVIGIDVSRDWLDLHCLPDGLQCRMPNEPEGHATVRNLPAIEMPSFALSRPADRNGSFGKHLRKKASSPDKCHPLR